MRKEVKSVEDWKNSIDQDREGERGRFKILSRELFNSRAFAALGGSATIVVLSILNKLKYEKKGKKDHKSVKVGHPIVRNNGEFSLTINELVARGLSRSTATRARNRAWELGFFDVIEYGSVHHAGKYRYSDRWRRYPHGDYKPLGQHPPGKNVYPENAFRSSEAPRLDDSDGRLQVKSSRQLKLVSS